MKTVILEDKESDTLKIAYSEDYLCYLETNEVFGVTNESAIEIIETLQALLK